MMKWCRLYHSILISPKIRKLPDRLFRFWVNCLVIASENDPRGFLPDDQTIAIRMGRSVSYTRASREKLASNSLLTRVGGAWQMRDWSDWNFPSDDVNQRVANLRAGKRNVTSAVHATPPDSDSDTDKKKHRPSDDAKKAPPAADAADAHDSPPAAADDPKPPATTAVVVMRPKLNRATRLSFETLPDEWRDYARELGWNPEKIREVWEEFHDYWIALPGRDGIKLDWLATWRNRCRLVRDRDRKEQKATHRIGATEGSLKFAAAMERRERLRKPS